MSPPEHLHDRACLRSLPEVAEVLGITRSAVNLMVHDGRLSATRFGPRWYVCNDVLESFRATYTPAPSAGRKLGRRNGGPDMAESVLELLSDWGEARVDEISEVVQRDPGNVRKYLAILRQRGLATKTSSCTWAPTNPAGREAVHLFHVEENTRHVVEVAGVESRSRVRRQPVQDPPD